MRGRRLERWGARFGPSLVAGLIRLLGFTLRFRLVDEGGFFRDGFPPAAIPVFWHNRLMMLPWAFARMGGPVRVSVMISQSKDGSLIADTAAKFSLEALRGSSSKGAAGVSRAALDTLAGGGWVGVTPDGPRGPVYTIKPGLVSLAQKTGAPIVPLRVTYGWKICATSWDRFQMPLPFSRMKLVIGKPLVLAPEETQEAAQARIKAALGE